MIFLLEMPGITGNQLLISVVGIIALVIGIILFMKNRFNSLGKTDLASAFNARAKKSPLDGRNKYQEVDAFRYSGTLLNFGFLAALGVMILAFSWTQFDEVIFIPDDALEMDDDIEIEPPRTAEPPPPPPPPPPPVIEEVPEEEIEEEEEIEFIDQSVEEETEIVEPEPVKEEAPPPPPPPPPPPKPEKEEIFKVVEDMPMFKDSKCMNESDKNKRKECSNKKMLEFIYGNIKYPPIARENGVEGTVVIRFVVDKQGNVTEPEIVRDIGAQCGAEALRVVKKMPAWIAGKQRGKPVKVYFNLPVKFRLE